MGQTLRFVRGSLRLKSSVLWGAAAIALALAMTPAESAADDIDFRRQIQPLLQKRCYGCHGQKRQESGLRLDRKASAFRGGDTGQPAVVAGKPEKSRLLTLVRGDDPERLMPPDGEPLAEEELQLLTQWISAGAAWPDDGSDASDVTHWAFLPPQWPAVPSVQETGWPANPIDQFILARLEAAGLKPGPEATRSTLIRRLSLDLTGLPPHPAQVEEFVADSAPDAYERLVDRLLASPHYGERWARKWLDLARYADTNGYEKDRARSLWPWRDWVIQSLNSDMPFDQFTIEQLAGDLLPDAGLSQQIATGFHRNTMINEEGGIDVEEFRFHSIIDRVGTTATTWLGLTVACAQCHSHKYDPISQREFYGLFAFLNNCDEPDLVVPDPGVAARREAILQQIAALEQARSVQFPLPPGDVADEATARQQQLTERFESWRKEATQRSLRWTITRPRRATSQLGATMELLSDGSVLVSGDKPNRDTYQVQLTIPLDRITGLRLEVLPDESLPDRGPGRAPLFSVGDFLLSEIAVDQVLQGRSVRLKLGPATESFAQAGRSAALATDGDLDTGWSIQGRTGEAHQAVFPFAVPLVRDQDEPLRLQVTLTQHYIHQMTIGRFRLSATDAEGAIAASGFPAELEDLLLRDPEGYDAPEQARLMNWFLSTAPELTEANKAIAELKKSVPEYPTTMVLRERSAAQARTTRRHHRGEFLKPDEPVLPGVPAILPPLPRSEGDAPPDRLVLARWLTGREHPLTARVAVNREWESLFGRGLVRTSEDFGTQGAPPTHPELLDWLSLELQRSGWSLKALHRLMVTSATYRQSSQMTPEHLAHDPQNELLGRFPRVRLDAELLRDQALAVSGLLNQEIGGPSVYPPQPEGVTQLAYGKPSWPTSTGAARYRRGLYTYAKRTSPYATFALFDAPSGEACVPRRTRSTTPLQALTLLNDPVFTEAAGALARRLMVEAPDSPAVRLSALFQRCLARPPTEPESAAFRVFLDRMTASGDELTAWTLAARAVLNLDEFVTRE